MSLAHIIAGYGISQYTKNAAEAGEDFHSDSSRTADTLQRAIGLPVIKESANHGPLTSAAEGVAFCEGVSNNGRTQNLIPPAAG